MTPTEAPSSRLVVVRHGSTPWSAADKHTGRTDVPLDRHGESQARALRRRLSGHGFARVLCSPLGRARATCELAGFGAQAEICPDLLEWDYGAYEGLTTDEICRERPGWSLWTDGVVGGETIEQVAARAGRVVAEARIGGGDTLAFAHGHVLRILAASWLEKDPRLGGSFLLSPAGLGVLGWERETPVLERWNDHPGYPLDHDMSRRAGPAPAAGRGAQGGQ